MEDVLCITITTEAEQRTVSIVANGAANFFPAVIGGTCYDCWSHSFSLKLASHIMFLIHVNSIAINASHVPRSDIESRVSDSLRMVSTDRECLT